MQLNVHVDRADSYPFIPLTHVVLFSEEVEETRPDAEPLHKCINSLCRRGGFKEAVQMICKSTFHLQAPQSCVVTCARNLHYI